MTMPLPIDPIGGTSEFTAQEPPQAAQSEGPRFEFFEIAQLQDEAPADSVMPASVRAHFSMAVRRKMEELGPGAEIVKIRDVAGYRHDLSGVPWQFYRSIKVKMPA